MGVLGGELVDDVGVDAGIDKGVDAVVDEAWHGTVERVPSQRTRKCFNTPGAAEYM